MVDPRGGISWTILFFVLAVLTGVLGLNAESDALGWIGRMLCLLFVTLSVTAVFSSVLPAQNDTDR